MTSICPVCAGHAAPVEIAFTGYWPDLRKINYAGTEYHVHGLRAMRHPGGDYAATLLWLAPGPDHD